MKYLPDSNLRDEINSQLKRNCIIVALALMANLITACSPSLKLPGKIVMDAKLTENAVITPDGTELSLHMWSNVKNPQAILLALHGFNDYGAFIKDAANFLAARGVKVYSYDQRGFGRTPHQGFWPGKKAFANDLIIATRLLTKHHPDIPLYLLGSSMGGAVVMTAMTSNDPPQTAGAILVAPAVWGRNTMPFYQRWALALAVRIIPWFKLSGRGLNIKASNNTEMLRALSQDPLVIKETRVDTLWGLVNLMDAALEASRRFDARAFILYGKNDQIIGNYPMDLLLSRLPVSADKRQTIKIYQGGYHMLLRDLEGETVWRDILNWIRSTSLAK